MTTKKKPAKKKPAKSKPDPIQPAVDELVKDGWTFAEGHVDGGASAFLLHKGEKGVNGEEDLAVDMCFTTENGFPQVFLGERPIAVYRRREADGWMHEYRIWKNGDELPPDVPRPRFL